jgi:hypothetical protein
MLRSANISKCGKYRYTLTRIWDLSKARVAFVMLNPSTADGEEDDPTIRRCISYAQAWGYGGLVVVNLFSYRATKPDVLFHMGSAKGQQYIIGNYSDKAMMAALENINDVVLAWGNNAKGFDERKAQVKFLLRRKDLYYITMTGMDEPAHPLFLRSDLTPKIYKHEKGNSNS